MVTDHITMCIQYTAVRRYSLRRVAVVGDTVAHSVSLIPEWTLTSSLRLYRTELKKCKLTIVFVQILSSKKYTFFHNGGVWTPKPPSRYATETQPSHNTISYRRPNFAATCSNEISHYHRISNTACACVLLHVRQISQCAGFRTTPGFPTRAVRAETRTWELHATTSNAELMNGA